MNLREELSALIHRQWALWAEDIAATEQINPIRRQRWKRLISTPYMELTEAEKDQDREWADKVLALLPTSDETHDTQRSRLAAQERVVEAARLVADHTQWPTVWNAEAGYYVFPPDEKDLWTLKEALAALEAPHATT